MLDAIDRKILDILQVDSTVPVAAIAEKVGLSTAPCWRRIKRLEDDGVIKGTKFGKMVLPGDPDSSNLMWLLDWRGAPETHMPLSKKKLSTCDRDAIRAWIREGAKNN